MNKENQYKWLIIVEGKTDKKTYEKLLTLSGVDKNDYHLVSAHGKERVCNSANWDNVKMGNTPNGNLLGQVKQDIGRIGFMGIILIIDTDTIGSNAFNKYQRNDNLPYIKEAVPKVENKTNYWYIDSLEGANEIPVYGISVPMDSSGCLETELLSSYGFPIEGQPEYTSIADVVKKASEYWKIPKHGDGKDWWEINQKAKMDKFIYSAFTYGFKVSDEEPAPPAVPDVIRNIKTVIGA